ncbi:MAG: hypothetical protein ACYTDU_07810 [Planctomycetota bacterium]|jgi:hypothetical protein
MTQKAFNLVAAVIFVAVFVLHVLRIVYAWEAVIGGWTVPMWPSWTAAVVTGFLAYTGLRLRGSSS